MDIRPNIQFLLGDVRPSPPLYLLLVNNITTNTFVNELIHGLSNLSVTNWLRFRVTLRTIVIRRIFVSKETRIPST